MRSLWLLTLWCLACRCRYCRYCRRTPGSTRWAGPELGQHTDEVLMGQLGLQRGQIQELRRAGAI